MRKLFAVALMLLSSWAIAATVPITSDGPPVADRMGGLWKATAHVRSWYCQGWFCIGPSKIQLWWNDSPVATAMEARMVDGVPQAKTWSGAWSKWAGLDPAVPQYTCNNWWLSLGASYPAPTPNCGKPTPPGGM